MCAQCKNARPEDGYTVPLCAACRDQLARRPLPSFVQAMGVVAVLAILWSAVRFPQSLAAGVAFKRGERAEKMQKFAEAASQYQIVVRSFPKSTEATARLGIVQLKAGQTPEAIATLTQLEGREIDKDMSQEIDEAIKQFAPNVTVEHTDGGTP